MRYCHLSESINFLLGPVQWITMLDTLTWTALTESNNKQTRYLSVRLRLNGPCKIMTKVVHLVFTTHHSKDRNFYIWPWNDTIWKSSYTQEVTFLATGVLLLCFVYFFRNKKRKTKQNKAKKRILHNFFKHNLYFPSPKTKNCIQYQNISSPNNRVSLFHKDSRSKCDLEESTDASLNSGLQFFMGPKSLVFLDTGLV